jgi:VanZ family protein
MLTTYSKMPRWMRDFLPLILWMGLIFWFSSRSTLLPIENEMGEKLLYKSAHITVYGVLAWLWWRAISPRRTINWSTLLLAVGLSALYGISDEIHQLYVPGRHGQVADVLFDTSGALASMLLVHRVVLAHQKDSEVIQL